MKRYYITSRHFERATSIDGEPSEEFLREYFPSLETLSLNSAAMPARDIRGFRIIAGQLAGSPSPSLSLKTVIGVSDPRYFQA